MLLLMVLFTGCDKESNENPDNNTTQTITPEKSSVVPYEIISLGAKGITLNADTYSGDMGGKEITILKTDTTLTMMVPDVPAGKHTLSVTINEKVYTTELTVTTLINVSNPDTYINDYLETASQQVAELESRLAEWGDLFDPDAVEHDMAIVRNYFNEVAQQLGSISPEDKQAAANIIAVNRHVIDSLTLSLDILQQNMADLIYLKNSGRAIEDLEVKIEIAMNRFIYSVIKSVANVKHLTVLLAGVVIGGPAIALAVGFVVGNIIYNFIELYQVEEVLLDYSYSVANVPQAMKSGIIFQNNTETVLAVTSNYSNINLQHASTGYSLLGGVAEAVNNFADKWNYVMEFLPVPLQMTPPLMSQLTQVKTSNARVHANYLQISNISNPSVTANINKNDGELLVTFSTTETEDVNFTFMVEYSNPEIFIGSATVSATLQIGVPAAVYTYDVIVIDGNSAVGGGDVTNEGSTPVTAKGICWSTTQNPTLNDSHTNDGSGIGTFSSNLNGLIPNTKYYVRAYATNSGGTAYGNEVSFTTSTNPVNLAGTKWDFLFIHSPTQQWHADVVFNSDGTAVYDEPAYPGIYLHYGSWSLSGNILSYQIHPEGYLLTGTVTGNTMSGTYVFFNGDIKNWSAVKYD